jgi:hypothetical protein
VLLLDQVEDLVLQPRNLDGKLQVTGSSQLDNFDRLALHVFVPYLVFLGDLVIKQLAPGTSTLQTMQIRRAPPLRQGRGVACLAFSGTEGARRSVKARQLG